MRSSILALILLLACLLQRAPQPIVVPSAAEVYPGQLFSISVTIFGDQDAFDMFLDPRLELVPGEDGVQQGNRLLFGATTGPATLYATFRVVQGAPPGDLRWPGGAVTRICCAEAPPAVWRGRRVYLPMQLH